MIPRDFISLEGCLLSDLDFDYTATADEASDNSLTGIHISLNPSKWFKDIDLNVIRFPKPFMSFKVYPHLQVFRIDGGHENSNIVPSDLFSILQSHNFFPRVLILCCCSINSQGALDYITASLSRPFGDEEFKLHIELLFGQWEEKIFSIIKTRVQEIDGTFLLGPSDDDRIFVLKECTD
ncbi:hypothetical protein BT69DRAFT_1286966 [Atractiella rhizophila]|nr:hypothetical protein BT69DRAFT_1286966 [Atractiella rhizophila]